MLSLRYPEPSACGIPPLAEGHVHVWRAGLDQGPARLRQLARTLCEAERRRADRFVFERDRNRFIACRGILREILSGYVQAPPDQIQFCYGRHGKLYLAEEFGGGMLRFNLSHSDQMAVFAFACGREIGIDLERVRADFPWDEITSHVCSRQEIELLQDLEETGRRRALFTAWTCKEAYVKARGHGLSFPPGRVHVAFRPLALQRVGEDEEEASRWSVRELDLGDEYVAAVVVEGHDWRLFCRPWTEAR